MVIEARAIEANTCAGHTEPRQGKQASTKPKTQFICNTDNK